MSDVSPSELGETPVVELRICRDRSEVASRFCESVDAAGDLVGRCKDLGATRIEVDVGRANACPHDVILRPEEYGG